MNIEKRGIRITDVPGVEYIETVPASADQDYDSVLIMFNAADNPINFGPTELTELRDALTEAIDSFNPPKVVDKEPLGLHEPGLAWARVEDIPADITRVADRDDDRWERLPSGQWVSDSAPGAGNIDLYGPFYPVH